MTRCCGRGRLFPAMLALAVLLAPLSARDTEPAATLRGVARDGNATPLAGAWIYAVPRDGGETVSASTDDAGRFLLSGLAGGIHEFAVSFAGTLFLVEQPIHVVAGVEREIVIAVGAVEDALGSPSASPGLPLSWRKNPLFAAFAVFGSAVLVGVLVEKLTDESNASPVAVEN